MNLAKALATFIFLHLLSFPQTGVAERSNQSLAEQFEPLFKIADSLCMANNHVAAFKFIDSIALFEHKLTPKELGKYQLLKGCAELFSYNTSKALETLNKALLTSEKLVDSMMICNSLYYMAIAHYQRNEQEKSIELSQKILSFYKRNDSIKYFNTQANMASSLEDLGRVQEALEIYLKYLEVFSKTKKYKQLAIVQNNLGELYRTSFDEPEQAIYHYQKSLKLETDIGNKMGISRAYHNMALAFMDLNEIDSALALSELELEIRKEIGDEGGKAFAYYNLGSCYHIKEDWAKAEEYIKYSLDICTKYGISEGTFHNAFMLAQIKIAQNKYQEAIAYARIAHNLVKEHNVWDLLADAEEAFYQIFKATKQFDSALFHLENKYLYLDTLQKIDQQNELNRLKIEYETDLTKAENENLKAVESLKNQQLKSSKKLILYTFVAIIFLCFLFAFMYYLYAARNKALRLQKETTKELQKSNAFKAKVLSVLSHDLRGPLSNLTGLLETMNVHDFSKAEIEEMLKLIANQTQTNLKTLNEVLRWSRLEMNEISAKKEALNPSTFLEEALSIYKSNIEAKKIIVKLENHIENPIWIDKLRLKSIIGNILNNAIKFSPKGGEIRVIFNQDESNTYLEFLDQGKGIAQEVIQNLNSNKKLISHKGTSGEVGAGIGLRIVRDFVNASGGALHFSNRVDGGTKVRVSIPNN